MSVKIRKHTDKKRAARAKRHRRIRGKMQGSAERPRLAVFRSHKHIYAQIIDDVTGNILVQSSSLKKRGSNIEAAGKIGSDIAKKATSKKIKKVVFDVAGFKYHGRVKALAEAARKGGLVF